MSPAKAKLEAADAKSAEDVSATAPLVIVYRKTSAIVPFARNSRTHSAEQIAQIAASIDEFGFVNPILLDDDGTIIAGHARLQAAEQLKMAEIPTITIGSLSDAQRRALVIADNKLAMNAGWDEGLLRLELGELRELGFDIGLTGFGAEELGTLFGLGDGQLGGGRVGSLAERFGIAPFSVLNAREGWWQDRKRGWLALGIQSEVGRGANLLNMSEQINAAQRGEKPYGDMRRGAADAAS